jgi:hypothetical protein
MKFVIVQFLKENCLNANFLKKNRIIAKKTAFITVNRTVRVVLTRLKELFYA